MWSYNNKSDSNNNNVDSDNRKKMFTARFINSFAFAELLKKKPEDMTPTELMCFMFVTKDFSTDPALFEFSLSQYEFNHNKYDKTVISTEQTNENNLSVVDKNSSSHLDSLPKDIFLVIASYLDLNALLSISKTSKKNKTLSDQFFLDSKFTIAERIFSLPPNKAMEFINYYRSTQAYKDLSQKAQTSPGKMTNDEIVCYTLTTDDITQIDFQQLDKVIDEYENENELRKDILAKKLEKNTHDLARYQTMANILASIDLTSLAIKRSLVKNHLMDIQKRIEFIKDKTEQKTKREELINTLITSDDSIKVLLEITSASSLNNLVNSLDIAFFSARVFKKSRLNMFCNLAGSNFSDAQLTNLTNNIGIDLRCFNLEKANWSNSLLCNAFLLDAYLINTNLTFADLAGTNFGRNLLQPIICGCNFICKTSNLFFSNNYYVVPPDNIKNFTQEEQYEIGRIFATSVVNHIKRIIEEYPNELVPYLSVIDKIKKQSLFNSGQESKTKSSGRNILDIFEKELKQIKNNNSGKQQYWEFMY